MNTDLPPSIRILFFFNLEQKMNTIHYPDPHSHIVIEIAEKDFPTKMKWYESKKACADLGEGWRLPTYDELNWIYKHKNTIGGFTFDS